MILEIDHLTVNYGSQTALSIQTPLRFEEGDRIGIIGANGAGKSTLVKSILGLTSYKGIIRTRLKPEEIAVHMQHNHYVDTMSVKHIIETILNTTLKHNLQLMDLITFFEFEDCLCKKYSHLSGGQKQRLTIILVLIQDSPLVFFDEVTSGLDFETRQRLMEKLATWYKDKRTTLCVVSHYYEELEQLVNKLLILDGGEVVAFGNIKELFKTYCGNSILTLDYNLQNDMLTKDFKRLESQSHLIALACSDRTMELAAATILINKNINFKRSNCDIEILSINAKAAFQKLQSGGTIHAVKTT